MSASKSASESASQGASQGAGDSAGDVQWHARLADLPTSALALLAQAGECDIYMHPAWLGNLLAQVDFAPHQSPGFALLMHGSEARIVLPMRVPSFVPHVSAGANARPAADARRWPALRCAGSLANYYSPLAQPAAAPGVQADDWRQLFLALRQGLAGPLDSLRLAPLDLQHPQAAALQQGLAAAGWRTRAFFCFGNWHQPLAPCLPPADAGPAALARWPAYWAQREGALRNTAARMGRRFARAGGRFEVVTGAAGLANALAAYADVYAHSWKPQEPHPGFMPGLARAAAAQGWLRLGLAWLGTQPVAAQLWLVQGRQACIYKLAYREDAAGFSPGTLLTAHLMQQVLADPAVEEVDYGMGDDAYKPQWMAHRRERWGLEALNPARAGGRWLLLRRWAAGRLKPRPATGPGPAPHSR